MFLQVSVIHSVHRGGGHAWFYLGGHPWFYLGGVRGFIRGACVVLFGGMRGFIWGACMVLLGGHAWFYLGGHVWFYLGGVHGFIRGGMHGFIWGGVRGFIAAYSVAFDLLLRYFTSPTSPTWATLLCIVLPLVFYWDISHLRHALLWSFVLTILTNPLMYTQQIRWQWGEWVASSLSNSK